MSLGKMSRLMSVRRERAGNGRSSSTKEDARTRRSRKDKLHRHHSESDLEGLSTRLTLSGEMRIMQLRESPGAARRAFPSPAVTPIKEDKMSTRKDKPNPTSSHPSIPYDPSLEEELADPGYALPSICSKSNSTSQLRTSTPMSGRNAPNGIGISTPVSTPSPSSTISSTGPKPNERASAQKKEAQEDRAGGYDILSDVREASASLPRMTSNASMVDESVSNGPIRREEHLRKLGRRFKSWKRRWVSIRPTEIAFFKTHDVTTPSRVIQTSEIRDVFYPASVSYAEGHAFEVVTSKRSHLLAAASECGARAWVHLIQRASSKIRLSNSAIWQGSGRSSSQSGETRPVVDMSDIEPYAQAMLPGCFKAPEPTYAIASRKMSDGGLTALQRNQSNGDDGEVPPILPPRQYDNDEDDDSSDDGDESKDILTEETPRFNNHLINEVDISGTSSNTLLVGSESHLSSSGANRDSTVLVDYNPADDGVVVFF